MRQLLRFYLFHKNSDAHRRRNGPAARLIFFLISGYGFGLLFLGAWASRGYRDAWPALFALCLFAGATLSCWVLTPPALRVHRVLEKYKDPRLFENELFRTQDQDVAEALILDSFGRTVLAVNKLKFAIAVNPNNVQAA